MFPSDVFFILFILFVAGCWLAFVWTIARRSRRIRHWSLTAADHPGLAGYDAQNVNWYPRRQATAAEASLSREAPARHPANRARNAPGRSVPIGPDDDPEFLRMLDRLISGTSDPASELPVGHAAELRGPDREHQPLGRLTTAWKF
jgi:hypothetical protein